MEADAQAHRYPLADVRYAQWWPAGANPATETGAGTKAQAAAEAEAQQISANKHGRRIADFVANTRGVSTITAEPR